MTIDLFAPAEWSGEFFFPDSYETRFQGQLSYSSESGLVLEYLLTSPETFRCSRVIHGILNTGERCTLLGKLPFPTNFAMRNGVTTRSGVAGFPLLAIGDFLEESEVINDMDFTLTSLQEFFFPTGFKDTVKFSEDALYSMRVPFGVIEVGHSARFSSLSGEIEGILHSHEPEALRKLSEAFKCICLDHPEAFFSVKKEIEYRIIAKFDSPCSVDEAYRQVLKISNLFSVLLYSPVYPESIKFRKLVDGRKISLDLYPSLIVDPRTSKLCKQVRSHFHMPITQENISLDTVIERWFIEPERYSVIISALQDDTGFHDEHSTHGDLLLYVTHLESISFSEGQKDRKYTYPLETYAGIKIRLTLLKAFGVEGLESVGEALSDLRNEIAHVGRPRKWLASLSLSALVSIANCLELVVLGHILNKLGVPENVRLRYQDTFC